MRGFLFEWMAKLLVLETLSHFVKGNISDIRSIKFSYYIKILILLLPQIAFFYHIGIGKFQYDRRKQFEWIFFFWEQLMSKKPISRGSISVDTYYFDKY